MRKLATGMCVVLALLARVDRAHACSCMEMDVPTAFARADAVFEGRVASIERTSDGVGAVRVTFDVVQQWKGIDHEHVVVETAADSAACGVAFEEGTSWLVYAQDVEGVLHTGLCSRTKRIEEADEDRAELGAAVVPVDVGESDEAEAAAHQEPPARGGCASCSVIARSSSRGAELGVALVLLALALRRSRR